jgi:glucokinase
MPDRLFVGLDVGGTTMKAGVVDDSGRLLAHVSLPTEPAKGQQHGLATMAESVRQAVKAASLSTDRIAAIGVATPGSLDIPSGVILNPPNLKPWRNVPVRQYIADTFGLPTAFQNDANAAAYGESWVGVGKDFRSLVLFTLGTGIGGGIIIDGRIWEGAHSHGGELGHMKIDMTGARQCGCGQRGCLEAYASATAVVARTYEALQQDGGQSHLHSAGELTAQNVFVAADAGDSLAKTIVDRTAFYLAIGAANAMNTIDPELICFAGGMIAAGEPFLNLIRRYIRDVAFAWPAERVTVRYAALGNDAGVIGAAGCARLLLESGR